jgi:hypothetical protein
MIEYKVVWWELPFIKHMPRVLFVEAKNAEDAKTIATDYIERKFGVLRFNIESAEAVGELPPGNVKEHF